MGAVELDRSVTAERFGVRGMTCSSCVRHVEASLGRVTGVASARVDLGAHPATVVRDPALAQVEALQEAVAEAGYVLLAPSGLGLGARSGQRQAARFPLRPIALGLLSAFGLLALYLGLVTLAQGWDHARALLIEDRFFVGALSLGFGAQVGLFAYLRGLRGRTAAGGLAASTGTSATAMLACCAHHLTELLPILGVSGAAVFLSAYKTELLWIGVGMNLMAIAYLLWRVRQAKRITYCGLESGTTSKGLLP